MHVVCYHYPCVDGVLSALAAHLHFKQQGQAVRFFPLTFYRENTAKELELRSVAGKPVNLSIQVHARVHEHCAI